MKVKIISTFNARREINVSSPQGLVLEPLLFNVVVNVMFSFVSKTKSS